MEYIFLTEYEWSTFSTWFFPFSLQKVDVSCYMTVSPYRFNIDAASVRIFCNDTQRYNEDKRSNLGHYILSCNSPKHLSLAYPSLFSPSVLPCLQRPVIKYICKFSHFLYSLSPPLDHTFCPVLPYLCKALQNLYIVISLAVSKNVILHLLGASTILFRFISPSASSYFQLTTVICEQACH